MILSDNELNELVSQGHLPLGLTIGPSSVDLTLSNSYSWIKPPKGGEIILGEQVEYKSTVADEFILQPNAFVLASTQEDISVPNDMAAYVEGRSSVGRLGLQVQNASFIDGGFHGEITLELANQTQYPILLKSGMRICQIVYFKMSSPAENPYNGKYNGQQGATSSRLFQDKD